MASKLRRAPLFPYEGSLFLQPGIPQGNAEGVPTGMSDLSPGAYLICGGYGGILMVLASHPLDTIKVRMQALSGRIDRDTRINGAMTHWVRKTIMREGILGLYKGMGTSLLMVAPTYALYFWGFGLGMRLFGSPDPNVRNSIWNYVAAGAFSSILSTIMVAPGERIKCLLQCQTREPSLPRDYFGAFDCLKKLYLEGGVRHVYRGTVCTFVRDTVSNAGFFCVYESTIDYFTNYGERSPHVYETVSAGGLAGLTYGVLCMPMDVVKTIYQTAPINMYKDGSLGIAMTIFRAQGIKGLFKGTVPVVLIAIPANAVCFFGFEQCRRWLLPWFSYEPP